MALSPLSQPSLLHLHRTFCRICLRRINQKAAPTNINTTTQDSHNQAIPLTGYYADLLSPHMPSPRHSNAPPPRPKTSTQTPLTSRPQSPVDRARIVFGSRLAGPATRPSLDPSRGTMIAGVLMPARPEEPDNCCMSGCVNCVWDTYRDELELWAARNKEARQRLQAAGRGNDDAAVGGVGMGSEEQLFGDIPVGIREFMKTEKRLREMHKRERGVDRKVEKEVETQQA
ncbi:MAG: hypothetical protein M1834_003940 [Cirrosporium novae-zelandiae]|nr:MAG: hypothetical protein M1834_003940 [Cirrosporium novae-zelandiae]